MKSPASIYSRAGWPALLLAALLAAGCAGAADSSGVTCAAASDPGVSAPPTEGPATVPSPEPTAVSATVPAPTAAISAALTGVVELEDAGGRVNIRGGPGVSYEVIGRIKDGESVEIQRAGIRWHRIAWEGGTGYITADAVSMDPYAAAVPLVDAAESGGDGIPGGCAQIILSLAAYDTGWVWALEKDGVGWFVALGPYAANMGRNGPGKERAGDGKTPLGVFTPDLAFGLGEAPGGVTFPWREITQNSVWVGDSESRYYNQWVEDGGADADYDLSECERLADIMPQYELALNYGYNPGCTPYAGSALFLHVWKDRGIPTAGCTAVSREAMLALLRRLDAGRNPVFIQRILPGDP